MSLNAIMNTATSGLSAAQTQLRIVSDNVSNVTTPGYVRKTINQVAIAGNNTGISVNIGAIQRELDAYVQRQLRVENSGATYADTRARMFQQLQDVYGQPGSANTLETVYNNFTNSLQALSTSPDDPAARSSVISAAQLLTQQLNQMSDSIQGLRGDAELGIADAVAKANQAMSQIASLNQRIASSGLNDSATATMMDQRDSYTDQLSQLMDINIIRTNDNQVSIFTNSGVQLVGTKASQISFDAQGTMMAAAQWNADPSLRGVGTLTLISPNGNPVDLIQSNAIRSGQIAAYLQMRDQDLVQAQNQIDAIASAMAAAPRRPPRQLAGDPPVGPGLLRRRQRLTHALDAPLAVGEGAVLLGEGRGGQEDMSALGRLVKEEILDHEAVELAHGLLGVVEVGLGQQRILAHHVHGPDAAVEAALDHLGDHEPLLSWRPHPPGSLEAIEARRGVIGVARQVGGNAARVAAALDIVLTAQGINPGCRLTDVAGKHCQVGGG